MSNLSPRSERRCTESLSAQIPCTCLCGYFDEKKQKGNLGKGNFLEGKRVSKGKGIGMRAVHKTHCKLE